MIYNYDLYNMIIILKTTKNQLLKGYPMFLKIAHDTPTMTDH